MQDNMFGKNIIITEKVSALRQLGRNALRGKWATAIMAFVIYLLCINIPVIILNNFFGYNPANMMATDGYTYGMDPQIYNEFYNSMPKTSILSMIYILIVGGAFTLGISLFYLASFRGHKVTSLDIFLGFERFGKALRLMLFQSLFIFLWSMLFIIPGIIAAIRYSQAFFVLADDPEKTVRQCMDESKMMMKGNKAKYFLMNLSFIGWAILCSVPGGILEGIATSFTENDMTIAIAQVISGLFVAPVYAYMISTDAGFYEILAGHLIKETAPMPVTADQIDVEAPVETIEEVIEAVDDAPKTEADPLDTKPVEGDAVDEDIIKDPQPKDAKVIEDTKELEAPVKIDEEK